MNITITKRTIPSAFPLFMLRYLTLVLLLIMVTTSVFAQPANDLCTSAIVLPIGTEINYSTYDNYNATNNISGAPTPTCVNSAKKDVWFKATVPATGNLVIQGETNSNPSIVLSAYTGASCSTLSVYDCTATLQSGGYLSLIINDLSLSGQDIFIRIVRYNSGAEGSFKLGAFEQSRPVNEDCANAILLTNDNGSFSHTEYSNEYGVSSGVAAPSASCGFFNGADIWFKTMVPGTGRLVVNAKSNSISPVLVLYTGSCGALSYNTCAVYVSDETEIILNDISLANQMIYIRLYGDNDDIGGDFELLVLEPTDGDCSNPLILDGDNEIEFFVPYSNKYATTSTDTTGSGCGAYQGKDIWFTIDVPASGELIIKAKPSSGPTYAIKPALTVYSGSCGSLTEVACDVLNSMPVAFGASISLNALHGLANQTIYLRMHNFNSLTGGAFELSVHNPSPPLPVELIRFTANVFNAEVMLDWSTASESNNDYFLVEHSTDGQDFIPIGHLPGKGTSDIHQQYNFMHEDPFYGDNYYRLKQVDFNGDFEYSNVLIAKIRLEEDQFKLFPNPAFTQSVLTLRWAEDYRGNDLQVRITDALGRQVYTRVVERGSESQIFIDCNSTRMDAGIYYVQLSNDQRVIAHQRFNLVAN